MAGGNAAAWGKEKAKSSLAEQTLAEGSSPSSTFREEEKRKGKTGPSLLLVDFSHPPLPPSGSLNPLLFLTEGFGSPSQLFSTWLSPIIVPHSRQEEKKRLAPSACGRNGQGSLGRGLLIRAKLSPFPFPTGPCPTGPLSPLRTGS